MHTEIARSVIAVPPLARKPDLTLDREANAALVGHIEQGGVRTLMYGGNANLYNIGVSEYSELLDMLLDVASPETWVIPSLGPDFGKMMDQASLVRERPFPTAMILPAAAAHSRAGVENGIARVAACLGAPVIVYIRSESYISPAAIGRLAASGALLAVKYAVVRQDPRQDPYLRELLDTVDRSLVISGMGERPAIVHWRDFGLTSFTSGSVCVAPRLSRFLLDALRRKDYATAEQRRSEFLPLEDYRDAFNQMRVLHEAITLSGIADMGPMLPLMSNLEAEHHDKVRAMVGQLRRLDRSMQPVAA